MAARVRKGLDREKIAAATVRFLRRGGQGALVPGRMILTAAHVIQRRDWIVDEHHIEEVEIGGRRFKAEVVAVEPLSDIALVGAPDAQSSAEALAFVMAPGWLARRMLDPGRELREMRRHIRKNETRATP